jgi:hypothetical protein
MDPNQTDKSMDILEYGYEKGQWYSLDPESEFWEFCKESVRFWLGREYRFFSQVLDIRYAE